MYGRSGFVSLALDNLESVAGQRLRSMSRRPGQNYGHVVLQSKKDNYVLDALLVVEVSSICVAVKQYVVQGQRGAAPEHWS